MSGCRCRHNYTRTITRDGRETWSTYRRRATVDAVRWTCRDCGETLPLGPANDTPEVLVEVRAAAIVASEMPLPDDEWAGWLCHAYDDMIGAPARDGEWAGWLARVICTHDDAIRTLDAEARRG